MYSFEGKFRSTPNVSLGGKSGKDKLDKEKLLDKAHAERQKREEIRQRLHSALVLQSCIRSYLVRQRLKKELRQQFDQERSQVVNSQESLNGLVIASRWLLFFYNEKNDNERLTWLGQNLLRHKSLWISNDESNVFLHSEVLKMCCRCLMTIDTASPIAIPLRMLETFTSVDLIKEGHRLSDTDAHLQLLSLWSKLIRDGYFLSMLHLLSSRVPANIEPSDDPSRPPTPLAGTLLSLVARPLLLAGSVADSLSEDTQSMDTSHQEATRKHLQTITQTFISQILCKHPNPQMYYYIHPALAALQDFPISLVLRTLETQLHNPSIMKSTGLPGAVMKLVVPNLESLSSKSFTTYLRCLQCLIVYFPRTKREDDDSSSSEEDSDDDSAENRSMMEYSQQRNTKNNFVPMSEIISDCQSSLTSRSFIDACVNRRIHEEQNSASLDAICAVCYHFIAVTRTSVQKNRLLYTLAFSSSFLRKLWQSTIKSSANNKVTGQRIHLIQSLLRGSQMTLDEARSIQFKLVVFCTLFSHNLLSVHDTDFYNTYPSAHRHMAFTTSELVSIAWTIRDVCLALIKLALPETKTRFRNYNVKTVLHALSFGHSVRFEKHQTGGSRDLETDSWEINDSVFLFTVCRRLVKHLHTRDVRRSFMPKHSWLSNSILVKNEQSNDFAQRWHQRSEKNSAVAAHLANSSDEDIILSVTEARQLAVLMNIPFVIPFQTRVSIFMTMLRKDRESRESSRDRLMEEAGFGHSTMTNEVTVRREFLYEDAFNDLSEENAPDLRKRLRVSFVNTAGVDEAGYGAGVTREFLQQVMKTGFDPTRGYFSSTAQGRLYPNPHAAAINQNSNAHFHFLGRMLGKVIYEGMQVELPFASFFLCKILQRKNPDVDINHLQSLDPDFYKNLMYLHVYDGDVSDLDLNFTVMDESIGVTKVNELIPDGKNTPVNNSNKVLYMHLMANYKLNVQMRQPCLYFRRGLESVVTVDWLHMFDHEEFQTLVSGAEVPIDIQDLKRYSAYSGGYTPEHPTIKAFWEVLEEVTNDQLSHFLLFVTSCSRPPLLGFKELHPPFCIQRGGSEDRLPTASTCLNLLKLPEYPDVESLRSKLLYCLQSGTGFELS